MIAKNDKKVINGWAMYDWANSTYSLTITTAIFPSYFYWATGGKDAIANFLGLEVNNTVLFTYTLSVAFLFVALINPILGALADTTGYKKAFMKFFCYLGSLSCMSMFFFDKSTVSLGVISFGVAGIGYAGSLVFYNSYLPEIATEDQVDKVSAKGFALGYFGSVILLGFNLIMVLFPTLFGIPEADPTNLGPRISFLTVGLWWIGFSQITFNRLPDDQIQSKDNKTNPIKRGFTEMKKVWLQAKELPLLKKYLYAFFFFSMGVQTVMYMATIYGEEVVGMVMDELIILVLILQLVAIGGAYLFAKISDKKGNVFSLIITLIVWIGVCLSAFFIKEGMKIEYYVIGIFVGLVMGGVQSMARSTYSKLIPKDTPDTTSFFSFFETLEKTSIATGTLVYGVIRQISGTMNNSALALILFFAIGWFLLAQIPSKQSYHD